MKILGIDPGNNCGWAHSNGTHGLWILKLHRDRHPGRRLERFRRLLFGLKRDLGIDAIGYEDASFGSNNPNTAARHNELAGVIKLAAAEWEIPVACFKPNHLKKWLTGSGKAKKMEMIEAVSSRFEIITDDDNIADAIAVMERSKQEFKETEKPW